jgi:hypothetical protein
MAQTSGQAGATGSLRPGADLAESSTRRGAADRDFRGWADTDRATAFFKRWYFRATHSRLEPVIKVARMIKRHVANVLTYFTHPAANRDELGDQSGERSWLAPEIFPESFAPFELMTRNWQARSRAGGRRAVHYRFSNAGPVRGMFRVAATEPSDPLDDRVRAAVLSSDRGRARRRRPLTVAVVSGRPLAGQRRSTFLSRISHERRGGAEPDTAARRLRWPGHGVRLSRRESRKRRCEGRTRSSQFGRPARCVRSPRGRFTHTLSPEEQHE